MITILFFVFLINCFVAGATGSLFPTGQWYRELEKPPWNPPDWVFPVTWLFLYFFMSYAAARIAMLPNNGLAMAFWALQITLNTLWTPVFFGLHRIKLGFFLLIALWLAVAGTMIIFFALDVLSGLLFLPYLIWVSLAASLNLYVWKLNPQKANLNF